MHLACSLLIILLDGNREGMLSEEERGRKFWNLRDIQI